MEENKARYSQHTMEKATDEQVQQMLNERWGTNKQWRLLRAGADAEPTSKEWWWVQWEGSKNEPFPKDEWCRVDKKLDD